MSFWNIITPAKILTHYQITGSQKIEKNLHFVFFGHEDWNSVTVSLETRTYTERPAGDGAQLNSLVASLITVIDSAKLKLFQHNSVSKPFGLSYCLAWLSLNQKSFCSVRRKYSLAQFSAFLKTAHKCVNEIIYVL